MGFDHVALCAGAGRPTVLDMPNGLARGVRAASDFLMALQLTGAAKKESIANLQIRLPVVVIGGGLTAIDTATESLAYYPVQVEKFLARYEALVAERGEAAVRGAGTRKSARSPRSSSPTPGRSARSARGAAREGREPAIAELLQLGRRHHRLSPAADRQPVLHAEPRGSGEGAGGGHPLRRGPDAGRGRGRWLRRAPGRSRSRASRAARRSRRRCRRGPSWSRRAPSPTPCWRARMRRTPSSTASISARSTRTASRSTPERVCKPDEVRVLMYRHADGRFMSFFGDLHPSFSGNVVKAMGGAKQGYPVLTRTHGERCRRRSARRSEFLARGQQRPARHGRARRAADADHRRGRGRGAGGGAQLRARPVLPPAELRGAARRRSTARCSPWKAWR